MMTEPILWFAILGLAGGLTHVFVESKVWQDLIKFESIRQMILGAISGGVYWFLYSEHSFPNTIMAWVVGYMGTDFIISLIQKYSTKELPENVN